ncbi:dynamin-binding protein [Elysia marginata]|uniref:Dynamin-binding protein n=1 Tax=Elysia marginata TaxID=1093978 RepID=A0AAV4ER11_9GAST|nr:dynamin-binding protein [Elysia marginata]
MTLGFGDYAQAKFDFPGESPGDLTLKVGDVVRVTDTVDKNWLVGEKVSHEVTAPSGSFPAAFVEQLVLPSVRTGQKIFLAVEDFMAEQTGDLELSKGDIITGIEAVDEAWWRGKNGPLKGIFPLSFVAELWRDDGLRSRSYSARSGSLKSRSGSLTSSRTNSFGGYSGLSIDHVGEGALDTSITKVTEPTFARALVDVSPQLDGELAFQLGDLIEITEIIDSDWFFGRCHQKEGLVSAVCVELLDDLDEGGGAGGGGAEKVGISGGDGNVGISTVSEQEGLNPETPTPALAAPVSPQQKALKKIGEDEYRLRNSSSGSYTSENTRSHDAEIMPYAQVLYSFEAQGRSELSIQEGQIVTLIRHVDADWTEGEVDGKQGLFPTSFVDIVVDCAPYKDSSTMYVEDQVEAYQDQQVGLLTTTSSQSYGRESDSQSSSINSAREETMSSSDKTLTGEVGISAVLTEVLEVSVGSEIGLVLHTFNAQMEGDASVQEGDTVEVVRQVDDNWLEVRTDTLLTGLVPRNHVEIIGLWPKEEQGFTKSTIDNVMPNQNPSKSYASGRQEILKSETELEYHKHSDPHYSILPSQPCSTQEIHDLQSEERTKSDSSSSRNVASISSTKTSVLTAHTLSLPGKKSNAPHVSTLSPKPVLPPKPTLKPKPSSVAKAPMERSHSLNTYKPARPPPLTTAKPYSSLPRTKPHHVVSPNERRLSMSCLDAIIEVEMEKAKSRSSSQNSDPPTDKNTPVPANDSVHVPSTVSISGESTSAVYPEKRQSLPASFQCSDSLILANSFNIDKESVFNSSGNRLSTEDDFTRTVFPTQNASMASNTSASAVSDGRPTLLTSQSVSEDKQTGPPEVDQRRKSASYAEHTRVRPGIPTVTPQESTKQASFVNRAFEMEVDEGKLVDTGGDHHHLPAMPKRAPPSRPNNAVSTSHPLLSSKAKAPPPRPSGPKIAPAPSKVPLVPARAAPTPPKLVPKRPAPKAPGFAPPTNVNANNNNNTKSNGKMNEAKSPAASQSSAKEEPPLPLARPAPQPPVRQPPRPASLASPPLRAPPPRPSDLIVFSPDDSNNNQDQDDEISEETKKEMVKDLKTKLEENKADIKRHVTRTIA